MENKTIIFVVLSLIIFFVPPTAAANFKIVGEVTYNQFAIDRFVNGQEVPLYQNKSYEEQFRAQVEAGIGVYIGGVYSLNSSWGVESGLDLATSNYEGGCLGADKMLDIEAEKKEVAEKLYGPYLGIRYSLNQYFKLKCGVNYYFFAEEEILKNNGQQVLEFTSGKAEGVGGLLGGEIHYQLGKSLFLIGDIGYRFAKLELAEMYDIDQGKLVDYNRNFAGYKGKVEMDMSGLRLGTSIIYKF